ncbi:MAG TPA: SDR family oxidoreductase [Acidimicrobiales bacterium]|nr:SDR family oxidoreductase [Acidimicrobiales bacterium]
MGILERFRVDGRAAIVTGGGRGIGAACALALAEAGADVLIASRTAEQLDEVAEQIEGLGRRAETAAVDVNDNEATAALVEQAVAAFGGVDIVVNNAGGTMPRPLLDTSPGYLERAFHFNVTTAFALTKAAVPAMLARGGGAVVNIGSMAGRTADRGMLAYGVAKAALAHLTKEAAADLAPRIRVNGIAVGSVATSALEVVLDDDQMRTTMEQLTPLKRLGHVDDIAAACLWRASPAGSFVTGKVVEVDGGLQAPNLPLGLPDL